MKNLLVILLFLSFSNLHAQVTCESEEWYDESFSGYCYSKYPKGQIQYKIHFVNGEKNGLYEEFYENGNKSASAQYKDWDLVGNCVRYFENGNVQIEMKIDSSGTGNISVYHLNGKLNKTGRFERYARVGEWSYYNEDGTLKEVITYNEIEDHRKEQEKLDEEHKGEEGKWYVEWPSSVPDEFFMGSEEPYN